MTFLARAVARELPNWRRHAAGLRESTCRITVGGGEAVWNPETGEYDDPGETLIYEGPARLKWNHVAPQDANAGETHWGVDRVSEIQLPLEGTGNIPKGALVTITSNPFDPETVGMQFHILFPHGQTTSTQRRLPLQYATRSGEVRP